MKITNTGKGSRGLPLASGRIIEIAAGGSAEIPDADWASLSQRPSVKADIEAGQLVADGMGVSIDTQGNITGVSVDTAGAAIDAPKKRRKPKADDAPSEDA